MRRIKKSNGGLRAGKQVTRDKNRTKTCDTGKNLSPHRRFVY
jgi:hypothetical protein